MNLYRNCKEFQLLPNETNEYFTRFAYSTVNSGVLLRIRVTGDSMHPFINSEEFVTISKDGQYKRGDLVLFTQYFNFFKLHRIIYSGVNDICESFFQTKGDAVNFLDPPITKDAILGKVLEIEKTTPLLGQTFIRMESPFWSFISQLIVIKTLLRNHKLYGMVRPYFSPYLVTLYRTLRARLTT